MAFPAAHRNVEVEVDKVFVLGERSALALNLLAGVVGRAPNFVMGSG